MKIKLKNPTAADGTPSQASPNEAPQSAPAPAPATAPAPKLSLKFKTTPAPPADTTESQAGDAPKQKRKYTRKPKVDGNGEPLPAAKPGPKPKKRPLEDGDEGSPMAKRKPKPTAKSLAMVHESDDDDALPEPVMAPVVRPRPVPTRTQSVKLSFKPKGSAPQRTATAIIKVKGAGKPPPRPPGVGYDSEAEEAEIDPAIESQFVLRMLPGSDCDLLAQSIKDKTIGKSVSQGGPGVYFRFFDREGRRAMVTIQGRCYAASMVELPCVIESLKSWNKKDWVKTADVCQMLLVLGRVNNEEEAKKYSRPREVEPDSHRYPHGLTPPMRWVRKRRFRPRKSYLDVERIENQTEALLAEDNNAEETRHELVDSDHETSEEGSSGEDAEGEDEEMADALEFAETPAEEAVDQGELEQLLHAGFMADDEVQVDVDDDGIDALFGATIGVENPATSREVAMHALGQRGDVVLEPESTASTPAAATSPDDDSDDDDKQDEDRQVDQGAEDRRNKINQTRDKIMELENAIKGNIEMRDSAQNPLYRQRLQARIDKQIADKRVLLATIGEGDDDD
ncbi:hypothetical protein BU26DRAFT_515792 [Trematosphaeria pertusa]|uniref:TAFII55 protein conserved region domain-containing protein n=1 Tax=Trematosphaeria pertusa TaxID=390896 RepID=A0A6A6IS98_9PLEO|nr:uncharacterized protein BU26DRAFT_515792 [Trematosphaeria pertusa]KAF2253435.1 hypothetical protein BU26DRAFT_515792 [Trematosphaeria pertusa]